MKLSVIIPCFNAANTIEDQLEALVCQRWSEPWEIIVSDNGSTDNTVSVVKQFEQRSIVNLRIVDSSSKQGAAHARNIGASAAVADAFTFCDADDEVGSEWLAAIGNALIKYDFVASRFEFQKLNLSLTENDCQAFPQQIGLQGLWYPPFSLHAGGCGIGIKRSVHELVNGFDETMLCLEDTDYCLKVQQKGVDLHFVPEAVVHVRRRQTARGVVKQTRLWGQYNTLLYKRYRPEDSQLRVNIHLLLSFIRSWIDLISRLPSLRAPQERIAFLRSLGYLTGQIQGMVKYRVPPV